MGIPTLYFIAIILPEVLCIELTAIKEDFKERYQSKAALRTVPHITLKAPFSIALENHYQVINWFENITTTVSPFDQELKDYGAFNNRRNPVIFINPVLNESLKQLQKEVLLSYKQAFPENDVSNMEQDFHPHITVGYRDLKPHLFKEAWKHYHDIDYRAQFKVEGFHLLQHINKAWRSVGLHLLK